jgi:tetratricopeptide (TPR) repeat protein
MQAYSDISKMPDSVAKQLTFNKIVDFSDIRLAVTKKPNDEAFNLLFDGMKLAAILVEAVIKNQEKLNAHNDSLDFVLSDTAIKELKQIELSMLRASQKIYKNKKFVYECLMFCGMLQNDIDKARKHFDAGVKLLPEAATIVLEHSMMGMYALNGLYPGALEIQLRLNEAEPVTENFRVTSFLYYNMKDYGASRRFVDKIREMQPMDVKARLSLAAICLRELNPAQARSILMEAGMIEPENPEIIFLQAITDIFLNKASSAAYGLGYLINTGFRSDDCKRIKERFL